MGYSESTFKKYAFGRGGDHKKEYAVYAHENDDNSGRPLTRKGEDENKLKEWRGAVADRSRLGKKGKKVQ